MNGYLFSSNMTLDPVNKRLFLIQKFLSLITVLFAVIRKTYQMFVKTFHRQEQHTPV